MWEQIRTNRIRSTFVVVAMGMVLVATGLALGSVFGRGDPGALFVGGLAALTVWLVLWVVAVSQGDEVMLKMAGARRIKKSDHPQLWNIVEEMTIASELPQMPAVYVVDDAAANAFATGRRQENAAVAVTIGLLQSLNRDELQGVVAHEIGHIKNRDVALMVTAGVMVGAIALLADVGRRALWYGGGRRSRSSGKEGGGEAILAIVSIVLLILAPIVAQLVYFSLSRRREYLADASGAMFTRNPEGLANALEKIGGVRVPQADQSRVTAPMYIIQPLTGSGIRRWLSTHPPIEERVKILRGMDGRADYAAYQAAFGKVHGGRVVGAESLKAAPAIPATGSAGGPSVVPDTPVMRRRQASDAFLSASGYTRKACAGCDAILKIPAELVGKVASCPRCGTELDRAYDM